MAPHWKLSDLAWTPLEAENLLHAVLSGTTHLAMLLDRHRTILGANDAIAASIGVPLDRLIGTPIRDHLSPEAYRQRDSYVTKALETGRIMEFEDSRDHRTFVTRIVPILNLDGVYSHVFVLSEDVTRERHTETTLRESETKYQMLIENLPHGVFYKDPSLTYVMCNEQYAEDLGLTREEIIGKTDFDLFPRSIAESYRQSDRHVLETGEGIALEGHSSNHSRNPGRFQQFVKSPVPDPSGRVIGILGIYWDITERKQAEAQQTRFNEMQKRMTTLVAHDLKTPLTAIAGYTDLLAGKGGGEPERDEILSGIHRNVRRLEELIDTFLDLERIESRSLALERSRFGAGDFLRSLIRHHTFAWQSKGIRVEATADDSLTILGDRDLLGRALSNILSNAIRFTDQGSVRMTARQKESGIEIETADTGSGIAPSDLPHVFERSFHTDPGPPLDTESSLRRGLGLTLAKTIVEEHGGRIQIESRLGQGTVVSILLPNHPSPNGCDASS